MKDIVIFGTGGFAREVHQIIEDLINVGESWNFLGFLDSDLTKHGLTIHNKPVLGDIDWLSEHPNCRIVVAVGNPSAKRKICMKLKAQKFLIFASLVHPNAWVGNRVNIGTGTIICSGALITTDIDIRDHVIINIGSTVGHDTEIHDYCTIAPTTNISGNVKLGEGVDLGTGSTIIQGQSVGAWSIVGAGAVVIRDTPPNVTVVGNPAKVIKERLSGWHES